MTAAIVTCDQCQEPIDGYTFGRRTTENLCRRCWFALGEAEKESADLRLAAATRNRQIAELEARIKGLEHDLIDAEAAVEQAEEDADALRSRLRVAEQALHLLEVHREGGSAGKPC